MTDSPPYPDDGDDTRTPRWVKVSGVIALVLIVLLVLMHLTGGGLGGHAP
jgi:hypothetical protein